jgi:AraC-like DNA-binding protein
MFFEEANKILQFISAFLLILLTIFILAQRQGKIAPRLFLSAFFISRALIILFFASYFYPNLVYHLPDLYVLGEPVLYLYAPFLFLYTRSVTQESKSIRWYDGFHFLPFLLVASYFLLYFHFQPHELKVMMLLDDELFSTILVNGTLLWAQFAIYAVACTYLLIEYRIKLKLYNSSYSHELFNWLVFLVGAFLVWKGIFVSGYLSGIVEGSFAAIFKIFIELGFLFYASAIAYKGLRMPKSVLSIDKERYSSSTLTGYDKEQMIEKLKLLMEEEKPYYDPELNLKQLAKRCGIPVHHLSQILNTGMKQNFYTYINNLRIEEAKRMLADPDMQEMTVLQILYEVGFNSKSVFNTAFKKNTGKTPTAYRRDILNTDAA